MKLAFIGTGYVGLVTGVMMSHLGHKVTCIDVDQNKIDLLNKNKSPIYELGIEDYIVKYAVSGRLRFKCGYDNDLAKQDAVFITVGTPPKKDGTADLSYVYESIDEILKYISDKCIIVIKSTVPPGTAKEVEQYVRAKGKVNQLATNPEFLREGSAVHDFLHPDRIVVGVQSEEAAITLRNIYELMTDQNIELVETDFTTSELIKYASNTFLANKIAFINEMADLCETVGANVKELSHAVGLDKRIGAEFLKAGPGFGGSCFPKDILALQSLTNNVGTASLILDAVIKANTERPKNILKKIEGVLGGFTNKTIAVLGLTYKAGTDDLRSSPAIEMIQLLKGSGAKIQAFDPMGNENAREYLSDDEIKSSVLAACKDADIALCLTEWPEFKELDFSAVRQLLKMPIFIDLRNFLDEKKVANAGLEYYTVGLNLSGA